MAQWFCFTCMGYHSSEEEIQRCRATNRKPISAEDMQKIFDYVLTHDIIKADDK